MKRFVLSFTLFFFSLFILISCHDEKPSIGAVVYNIIVEYNSSDDKPEVRLSVFAETFSDVNRNHSVTLVNEESGMEWTCNKPSKLQDDTKKSWIGYTNFKFPSNGFFQKGTYIFRYKDLKERDCESKFLLDFDEDLFNLSMNELLEKLPSDSKNKCVIYNDSNNMIFYGTKNGRWKLKSEILDDYEDFYSLRDVYFLPQNNMLFIMPLKLESELE